MSAFLLIFKGVFVRSAQGVGVSSYESAISSSRTLLLFCSFSLSFFLLTTLSLSNFHADRSGFVTDTKSPLEPTAPTGSPQKTKFVEVRHGLVAKSP